MASAMLKYFAYGSNMHPRRLAIRVPSSRCIDIVRVSGYRLRFHKVGRDDSAKCNMLYTGESLDHVYGVVYQMRADERYALDQAEGLGGGYELVEMDVGSTTQGHRVFMYQAQAGYVDDRLKPYDWYHQLVLSAAIHHQFPQDYIQRIRAVEARPDPDAERARTHFRILDSL